MKPINEYRLFLASSKDLLAYRDQFEISISRKNQNLIKRGVFLNLFRWEDSLEVLSLQGKQNDYNNNILQTDVFVLLYASKMGKYTLEEFEVAYKTLAASKENKPSIFLYKCGPDDQGDPDTSLVNFINRVREVKHFPSKCSDPIDLMRQFSDQLDKLFEKGLLVINDEEAEDDQINEKIYFCDRQEQSQLFDNNITDADAIQFVLITGHERDIADYFVRRKEIELDGNNEMSSIHLKINLSNVEQDSYDQLDDLIKKAIISAWNKHELLKKYPIKKAEDYSVETMLKVLSEIKNQYLLISWRVKSYYWKSERLRNYISQFYERYKTLNTTLNTTLKIFFIGIIIYTDNSDMSLEEFQTRVKELQFGKVPVKLTKINVQHVKDWMEEYDLEQNPDRQNILINKVLPDSKDNSDYYMSELQDPLNLLLKLI